MKHTLLLLAGIVIANNMFAQLVPPYHLQPELLQGGVVQLDWEVGPTEGLMEEFDDGIAQDLEWRTPRWNAYSQDGYYRIEEDHAIMHTAGGPDNWGSTVYTAISFTNFTCELDMVYLEGLAASKGIIFHANGVRDQEFNAYSFLIAFHPAYSPMYSVFRYVDGIPADIIYWHESNAINEGIGAINTLKVVCQNQIYDFYINDVYVNTIDNPLYLSGLTGFMQSEGNTIRYNYLTCSYDAQLMPRWVEPEHGTMLDIWLDEAGRPTDHPPVMAEPETFAWESFDDPDLTSKSGQTMNELHDFGRELDEFVEYWIYRNGTLIGTSETESFTDQLPYYGSFGYRITAFYDPEGESIPSVQTNVTWSEVTYALAGQNTVVPSTGGVITYDALLFNELAQGFSNVIYKTYVTLPDQTIIGPTFQRRFTLGPGMSVTIPNLTQTVPANAPPGNYFFHGRLYYQGTPVREQTFQFDKMGP